MQNLGKILFILFLIQKTLFGGVVASVDSQNVSYGEMITYSLNLTGEDIQKPSITSLCGVNVVATSSSTSLRYINGNYTKEYILSYKFTPEKSCTIEAQDISIAGNIEKTLPIEILVSKTISSKESDFYLSLSTNKKDIYIGEPFELTVLLKQKNTAKVVDSEFSQPTFKGFWLKGEPKQIREEGPLYTTTKIIYTLAPQRKGTLSISSANIKIASRKNKKNYWGGVFPDIKWKTYFSNDLNISAKALPNGVDLVGNLNIEANVDKEEVNANEAVTLTLKVTGDGNLEDIKSFKPYIDGVSIFDEKILIKDNVLTQKITFVADGDFTIPAFTLKTFNIATDEMKIISTNEIFVQVKNIKKKEELKIKRADKKTPVIPETTSEDGVNIYWLIFTGFIGILIGIFGMLLKPLVINRSKKSLDLKNHRVLLVKLVPYKENEDVKEIVSILESNLYSDIKKEIDKKELKNIIKKYEIQ